MDDKLYQIMNWPQIEALVYSECDSPHRLLGAHRTKEGVLVQVFLPGARQVSIQLLSNGKEYPMEQIEEAGFFAILLRRKSIPKYIFKVSYQEGHISELEDPYRFPTIFTEEDLRRFTGGIYYEAYEKLGAHPIVMQHTEGVSFAVWAPSAMRVSVVGDFNSWDGRSHPMRRLGDSGVFDLFIPGLSVGSIYKYELKLKGGDLTLKADPYGNYAQKRPENASVIWDLSDFKWSDENWMKARAECDLTGKPMSVYEVHLGSWMRQDVDTDGFLNYREIAPRLVEYIKEMGYTHIELMPIMEHPLDASWGYQVTGYYAPTSRFGTPEEFMYFIDLMHVNEIGVILDWVPAHFPRDAFGLAEFDGTCLYEHQDPKQGLHPHWGTLIYHYGRPQVSNFLIANALYWVEKYHADGIRMDAVASMLYLDYGKHNGEWIPNIYGGNENLEAIEFLKHLNSIFKKRRDGAILIAEESTAWPRITGSVEEGLGFDYKWNMGWMNDFLGYMQYDPCFRMHHYNELTFSMIYAYSERFILAFSHDEVVHGKGSMFHKMPGDDFASKAANLRVAYGFMFTHPGKKLLFMGQDFAQITEWSENKALDWDLLAEPLHQEMQLYVKALNQVYKENAALYELDYDPEGFVWIDCISKSKNIIIFLRKNKKIEDTLLVICNFAPVIHERYQVGVPYKGKYKEIFNSDKKEFGGSGELNPRVKQSKAEEWDEKPYSIIIKIPPMGISIYRYVPVVEKIKDNKTAREKTVEKAKRTKKMVEDMKHAIMAE